MIAYKVFEKLKNGALMSAGRIPKYIRFCYKRNEINLPKIEKSRFFVFKYSDHARDFMRHEKEMRDIKRYINKGILEIWEIEIPELIEIQNSVFPALWGGSHDNNYTFSFPKIRSFWNIGDICSDNGHVVNTAYLTDSVKLIRKIK